MEVKKVVSKLQPVQLLYKNANIGLKSHGQFNNSIVTKNYLDKLYSIYDLDLLKLNTNTIIDRDYNQIKIIQSHSAATITLLIASRKQKVLIRILIHASHFFITAWKVCSVIWTSFKTI